MSLPLLIALLVFVVCDSLKERGGVFLCERGRMELSRSIAERLYSGFVSKTEPSICRPVKMVIQ